MPRLNPHVGPYRWIYNVGFHPGTLLHSIFTFLLFPRYPMLAVIELAKFYKLPVVLLDLMTMHNIAWSPQWTVFFWWNFCREDSSRLDMVPFGVFFYRWVLSSDVVNIGVFLV